MKRANYAVRPGHLVRLVRLVLVVIAAIGGTTACGAVYKRPKFITPAAKNGFVASAEGELRRVVLVGNNWAGTITVFDPVTYDTLAVIDAVPDWNERMCEIKTSDPLRRAAFRVIRKVAGEGNHQLVDDMFTSKDGRMIFVSRPSLADVVAIRLDSPTHEIVWRRRVEGMRADHAAVSDDGKTLLVSASTAGVVHAINTANGQIIGGFKSGDEPHENTYSHDGKKIYHASIGRVFLSTDNKALDRFKGERVFLIVDANSFEVLDKVDMRAKTKEAGDEWIHSAVRPMTESPNGRFIYFQMSFFHGFFEYDLQQKAITNRVRLPGDDKMSLDDYVLNSAHHGITINKEGTKLCVAGTMSDYAAIVDIADRKTFRHREIEVGPKPYWSTTSADGRQCYVSVSGKDLVKVISFDEEKEVGSIAVGRHPQRVRNGWMRIATTTVTK